MNLGILPAVMTDQILLKIRAISGFERLSDAEVHYLLGLARKLIERLPKDERADYDVLKFYADWALHSQIDRSEVGAAVLQRVSEVIHEHLKKSDNRTFSADLSDVLSLARAREQLNALVAKFGGGDGLFGEDKWWTMLPLLAEVVSNAPLTIANQSRFQRFLDAIRAKPLKGTASVKQLTLIKVPATTFNPGAPPDQITFCIMVETTDDMKLITPIVKTRAVQKT